MEKEENREIRVEGDEFNFNRPTLAGFLEALQILSPLYVGGIILDFIRASKTSGLWRGEETSAETGN